MTVDWSQLVEKVMIRSIKKVKLGGIWDLDIGGDGDKVYLGKDL